MNAALKGVFQNICRNIKKIEKIFSYGVKREGIKYFYLDKILAKYGYNFGGTFQRQNLWQKVID